MTLVLENRESILIVEDAPDWARRLEQHLTSLAYAVTVVDDAPAAIKHLANNKPDLVCCDLILPRGSGYEICEFISKAAHLQHTLIIVMSDRMTPQERAHATQCGAHTYMIKPFSMEDLTLRVEELLDGAPPSSSLLMTRPPPRESRRPSNRVKIEMPRISPLPPPLRGVPFPGGKKS